jgi:hypothetical protein
MANENGDGVTPENNTNGNENVQVDFSNPEAAQKAYQELLDKNQETEGTNKQLFARAKKAEGYVLKDGEWVKPEPKELKPGKKAEPKGESSQPGDLDYGQLAFHNTKQGAIKIEASEDVEFLQQTIAETGKSQKDILNSKWFASELKERQEARASANATPKGRPRSGQPVSTDLDEAMAVYKETGKLPDDFATRNKLVDLITDKEKTSMFNGPSVGPKT